MANSKLPPALVLGLTVVVLGATQYPPLGELILSLIEPVFGVEVPATLEVIPDAVSLSQQSGWVGAAGSLLLSGAVGATAGEAIRRRWG